jgi:hypothetical protein
MKVSTEQLLVLKAYYLGHGIAENTAQSAIAIGWIDRALDILSTETSKESLTRLLFYSLLKAEVARGTAEVLSLRSKAKAISNRLDPSLFDLYMKIEDATQTRSRAHGLEAGYIANEGIKTTKRYTVSRDRFDFTVVEFDAALNAVGIDLSHLSASSHKFLYSVTLKQMLKKHGIDIYPD